MTAIDVDGGVASVTAARDRILFPRWYPCPG
jgi:hypothetical protein